MLGLLGSLGPALRLALALAVLALDLDLAVAVAVVVGLGVGVVAAGFILRTHATSRSSASHRLARSLALRVEG